jgi:hypothetical protein
MAIDSAFWLDLEAQFREQVHPVRLVATVIDTRWNIACEGSTDKRECQRRRELFVDLAMLAGVAAGAESTEGALVFWLDLLRREIPYRLDRFEGSSWSDGTETKYQGGWIQDVVSASAEYCRKRAIATRTTEVLSDPDRNSAKAAILIERLAMERFSAGCEARIEGHAQKEAVALADARRRGNIGGYRPALIQCRKDHLQTEILAFADAWVEAATVYRMPLPLRAEEALEKAALEMAAGTNSAICGELELMAKRTNRRLGPAGANREIEATRISALREGKLRFKMQRINVAHLLVTAGAKPVPLSAATGGPTGIGTIPQQSSNTNSVVTALESGTAPKRRGRPQTIPNSTKAEALKIKMQGGTNRDAAKKLYDTKYPTTQQVKNVCSILRYYTKGRPAGRVQETQDSGAPTRNPGSNEG